MLPSIKSKVKDKETLQLPQIATENFEDNENVAALHIKNLTTRLRTNSQNGSEAGQDSRSSKPGNRRRSRRFEEALVKWQEYGNDIIERKPPNFLGLNNTSRKGTRIFAGGKYTQRPDVEVEESREPNEKDKLYQKQVEELAGRLSDNFREFEEMRARSAKIELTLKQLKEKAMTNLENE